MKSRRFLFLPFKKFNPPLWRRGSILDAGIKWGLHGLLLISFGSDLLMADLPPVVQPEMPPGKWKVTSQPLPPLKTILALPEEELPVYGLYVWANEYLNFRKEVKKIGWVSVRIGGPMEDAAMKALAQDNLEVMKTIDLGAMPGEARKNRKDFDSDEAFIQASQSTMESFLKRYGPGGTFFEENSGVPNRPVRHVEIWNEPNFQYMIPDGGARKELEKAREALYAKLLPALYQTVKQNSPEVQVLGFAIGGGAIHGIRFVSNVHSLKSDLGKDYDILSTHPYTEPAGPEMDCLSPWGSFSVASGLEATRSILAKNGAGDKKIWFTEVGWPITQKDGGEVLSKEKSDDHCVPPLFQAANVCRMYAMAMRLGVSRVHIMFLLDTDGFNGGFFSRKTKSWRPSAYAVQTMIRLMPHPKLVSALVDGIEGSYAYEFLADAKNPQSKRCIMVWNVTGPKKLKLPIEAVNFSALDMLGNTLEITGEEKSLTVEIGPCPVYLVEQ